MSNENERLTALEATLLAAMPGEVTDLQREDIMMAFRHAMRSSELVALQWSDVDLSAGRLHVRRAKGGHDGVHPLGGRELRALRRLHREMHEAERDGYVFVSERGAPMSVAAFQRMVARAGKAAGFPFAVSSHALRHGAGYALVNRGTDLRLIQSYMGHASIQSTVRYTALASGRFNGLWRD